MKKTLLILTFGLFLIGGLNAQQNYVITPATFTLSTFTGTDLVMKFFETNEGWGWMMISDEQKTDVINLDGTLKNRVDFTNALAKAFSQLRRQGYTLITSNSERRGTDIYTYYIFQKD